MLIVFLFCLPLLPKFFLQESIPTAEPVSTESSSAGSATVSQLEEAEPAPEPEPQPLVQTVRFSATGDNLIHSPIYKQAKRRAAGTEGYSFDYCYEHIAPFYVQQDVNWINQETLCTDELEPSTYPCFSTPGDCARALYRAGVRVFSLSNNHTYDKGASGIAATLRFWGSMPEDVVTTGLWKGESDYGHIPLQTVNGVTIAYLSYTEHTNGIPQNSSMQANVIYTSQTDVIEQQVKAARQLADFVVVGVHWSVENSHAIADPQRTLAQNLADWGADLIILSVQLEKTTEPDGTVRCSVLSPRLLPTVTHYDAGKSNVRTYLFRDYTEALTKAHGVRKAYPDFSLEMIQSIARENIDPEFLQLT